MEDERLESFKESGTEVVELSQPSGAVFPDSGYGELERHCSKRQDKFMLHHCSTTYMRSFKSFVLALATALRVIHITSIDHAQKVSWSEENCKTRRRRITLRGIH